MPRSDGERPLRADARRNRELLLAAAREVFDEQGADASLDEIARRAGTGNATLYRHFPTRRELIVAVYASEVADLCAAGETGEEPGEALFGWLRAFIAHVATKRDLAFAISGDKETLYDEWHQAMRSTASALLVRAQADGAVRATVTAADLLAVATGIAVSSADSDQAGRCLDLLRHGTTPG
ncbi:MAG: helix-turn-helix domain-containing protein [Streptosporangiaceae bacterium]